MGVVDEPVPGRGASLSVMVVNDGGGISASLGAEFPNWAVVSCDDYLSAISSLSRSMRDGGGSVDAVFAYVDLSVDDLADAVAGMREAAGAGVKLLLCCRAEAEPLTRSVLSSGADDYLICPLVGDEVASVMSPVGVGDGGAAGVVDGAVSVDELGGLGALVEKMDGSVESFLDGVASFLRDAFGASHAGVVHGDVGATVGEGSYEPVLREVLKDGVNEVGHLAVGPAKSGGYVASDRAKLCQYARLIASLVTVVADRRRLSEWAFTDELSGLPNRRYLLRFLDEVLAECRDGTSAVTLLMFDVDSFKSYNDAFGHDAGDEIIRGCGELFRRNCREHDLVTRYGGDEFAVVFWDKDGRREAGSRHPSDVMPIIERFRRSLRDHNFDRFPVREGSRLTISGGLASCPSDARTRDELIMRADRAMLRAKREGKNRIVLGGGGVRDQGI